MFQAISKCNYFMNFPTSRDVQFKMKEAHRYYSVEKMYLNSLSFQKNYKPVSRTYQGQ